MRESIRIEGICKRYVLGARRNQDTQLREQIVRMLKAPFRRNKTAAEEFWALQDVSISIEEGEIVGIIGGNGAGKSTLLKILSKITYPTSGRVRTRGRIASLLEVGTGFHEELTGRENVFLNGSILGMRRREVEAKLDAIVAFSGVERFLDTPIKRYSSGMRLRLGFAVAAHLDPDILIVDEVLAVGDAAFQKKCLNAMQDMRSGGRTVLFVSHHMASVEGLCNRGIWLDKGKLRMDGPVRPVIDAYMGAFGEVADAGASFDDHSESRKGTGEIRFTKVEILDANNETKNFVRSGDAVTVRLHYQAHRDIAYPHMGFRLVTDTGAVITDTSTWHHAIVIENLSAGAGYLDVKIHALNLMPSRYYFSFGITGVGDHLYDWIERGLKLDVEPANIYNSGMNIGSGNGFVFFPQRLDLSGMNLPVPAVTTNGG